MDYDQDDTVMEGLALRNSGTSNFDRGKPTSSLAGMNGNTDTSLAPSLLPPFQKPHSLPIDRGVPPKPVVPQADVQSSTSPSNDTEDDAREQPLFNENDAPRPRGLPVALLPTGLCYDIRMRYHCEVRPKHGVHPEDPRRVVHIYNELCRAGLADGPQTQYPLVGTPLKMIYARDATIEEICRVHTRDLYDFVESTKYMKDEHLIALEDERDSIYFCKLTWLSSILSVGGAIETCRAVVKRDVKNAIAVIRPPGHHAEVNKSMGFCLFNNVCVAARACQQEFKEDCRKILILDWDVHHGNGVQKVFYDDPNVLYISLHVYQDGHFYPGGPEGDYTYCGRGNGLGKNVNIPWPAQGRTNADYIFAFQQVVMPIAYEFDPDLVIISAGFDAADGDELGGCFVQPACYAHMTHMLMSLAQGKVAVCLEGGYNFKSISVSALAVTRTLMGEPPDRIPETSPTLEAIQTVRKVVMQQSAYWNCMYPKVTAETLSKGERMHDIIRHSQARFLYDNYKMISLYIYRDQLSKSFENQVLATPDYDKDLPLLVIFHDPPELSGVISPTSTKLELQNTWLNDSLKDYIKWGVERGFSVMDVNIPRLISGEEEDDDSYEEENRLKRLAAIEELASYLWENYIEVNDSSQIFFVGVGDAFHGLASLLIHRDNVHERIKGVISFVANNPLRPVASQTNPWLSKWYIKNSLVFVSPTHNLWAADNQVRRPSKRYGKLIMSTRQRLSDMLKMHRGVVFQFLLERAGRAEDDDTEDEPVALVEPVGTFEG